MQDDSEDLMVRAAWYYHVEGMTQAEIAARLNMTRRRVNEMLAQALETGVVSVNFNSPLRACVELESRLCEAFGLKAAVVVPTPSDPRLVHKVVGRATAEYFNRLVQSHRPRAIGVGWGATLRETIQAVRPVRLEDVKVYSMIGGLTHGTEINTFETARSFAEVLAAKTRYLVAPIYMESPESREIVAAQAAFRKAFEAIGNVDIALVSAGDVTEESLLVRYGLPESVDPRELLALGAVGDLIGRYIDADGVPIDHPLNHQVMSPEIGDFRKIPTRIVTSGGEHKHAIMRAVVAAGHVNVVVTDSDCARHLLSAKAEI